MKLFVFAVSLKVAFSAERGLFALYYATESCKCFNIVVIFT